MSIGDALAQARRQAGLTISQVSQRTCIRETIVRDIERGDFSSCGGDFYARGHIRSIARAVGVDPEELIREYDVSHGRPLPITAADVFEPATPIKLKERRHLNWTVAMVLALVVVVGFGVYRATAGGTPAPHRAAGASSPAATPGPTSTPSAAPSPTVSASSASSSHRVVVHLTALPGHDCWVGFYSATTGLAVKQALVVGGASMTWRFRHAIVMKIGNPGYIRLTVNGQDWRNAGVSQPVTLSLGPGKRLPGQAASG